MNKFAYVTTALAVSLGVNIFELGVISGHHFGGADFMPGHMGPPQMGGPQDMLFHMERVLSPEDARIFDEQIRASLSPPDDANITSAIKAVRDALTTSDFSPEAFRQALQHIHDQRDEIEKRFDDAFTKAVGEISPEGRRALSEALPDHPFPGHMHDKGDGREMGPGGGDMPPPP